MLSVCILCAANSCVLNDLQFLDVGVLYDRAPYGVCIFQNGGKL